MKELLCAAVTGLVLAGCAAQRPQMPTEKYASFAYAWNVVGYCAFKGWMDADTAARGKTYINSTVGAYSYSVETLRDTAIRNGDQVGGVTQEQCRTVAVEIHTRKQQIANQNLQTEMEQREIQNVINNRPTQTYCNKIGNQLLCNSY